MDRTEQGLDGRAVVLTGAAGGIGRAVAAGLAERGCSVVCVDQPDSPVHQVAAGLPGEGHVAVPADVRDLSSHADIFGDRTLGGRPLAGLAHLAALLIRRDDIDSVTEQDWDDQMDVNLKASFFINRAAAAALRAQGDGGSIVNFASQGWWTGGFGGSVVYNASKGGIVTMSRGLARTLAPHRIRVNTIAPGAVDTPMMREGMTQVALDAFVKQIPLSRMADPSELAGAVAFLLSSESSYVTGATLNVSGGQLMY